MFKKRKKIIIGSLVLITFIITVTAYFLFYSSSRGKVVVPCVAPESSPTYTLETLAKYNGTNDTLPIYLALDGCVYDVTPGKSYYGSSGTYHSLAGKDASQELPAFVGSIVKGKYKVVGVFSDE